MLNGLKLLCFIALVSLTGCNDVLVKPLASADRPSKPDSLDGVWLAEGKDERVAIRKTAQQDWYQFSWQQGDKLTEGRFVVAYFKFKQVWNIDLTSVKVNGKSVINGTQPAFLLLGAVVDDEELELVPADMEQFEKKFSQYFYASPIMAGSLCVEKNSECTATFTSGNMLMPKRMRKFNDEFGKKYRSIFPGKKKVIYRRQ